MVKIFIDPGHGGKDPGAIGNGLVEKNLTLQIAKKIDELLTEYENVTTKMSRTGDETVSLLDRTNKANQWDANFYLSIHINAGGGTGFESFVYHHVPVQTLEIQKNIHEEIIKLVDFRDRGLKKENFHVLRETKMHAVLTENGFIDHPKDAHKLKDPSFIEKIARGHVNGIAKAFQLKKKQSEHEQNDESITGKKLYKVQIGAFEKLENAKKLAEQAKKAGFQVTILKE